MALGPPSTSVSPSRCAGRRLGRRRRNRQESQPEDADGLIARTMQEIFADPSRVQQVQDWQAQRRASGQGPYDWAALRQHVQAIGGPDPGQREPEDFNLHAFWPISS